MKLKFRLKKKGVTVFDPETKNSWSGNKVIESEVTIFITRALGKGVLELVEDEKKPDKKPEE